MIKYICDLASIPLTLLVGMGSVIDAFPGSLTFISKNVASVLLTSGLLVYISVEAVYISV